jgi:hypothetical protein
MPPTVFGTLIAAGRVEFMFQGEPIMGHLLIWPTLALLAGTAASIPMVENSNNRALLYWVVLSPAALGLAGIAFLAGIL